MFYLKIFYKLLWKNIFKASLLAILIFALVFSLAHKDYVEKNLLHSKGSADENSYFYALVSSKENLGEIRAKMAVLPGVEAVQEIPKEQILEEVKNVLASSEVTPQMLSFDYQGLKLVFELGLKKESQQLIREYLHRLALESSIILGATREASVENKPLKQWEALLLQFWVVLSLGGLILVVTVWSFKGTFFSYAYLIENYQRKRRVALKAFIAGFFSLVLLALALSPLLPMDFLFMPLALLLPLLSFPFAFGKSTWKA